jgi:hypothetical protein
MESLPTAGFRGKTGALPLHCWLALELATPPARRRGSHAGFRRRAAEPPARRRAEPENKHLAGVVVTPAHQGFRRPAKTLTKRSPAAGQR